MQNAAVIEKLFRVIREGHTPHAILLTGPDGRAGEEAAKRAAALYIKGVPDSTSLVNCPDYFPLGVSEPIHVDAVRELQLKIAEKSFSGRRAVVFFQAHLMKDSPQNALLKTLEEPPDHTLILLVGTEEGLLRTIRSRCMIIRLGIEERGDVLHVLLSEGADRETAVFAAWLSNGVLNRAREACTQDRYAFFVKASRLFFKQASSKISLHDEAEKLIKSLELAPKEVQSKSAKARLSAVLMIDIFMMLASDVLRTRSGLTETAAHPLGSALPDYAQSFTIARIQGIIELLLSAKIRVAAANPLLTVGALLMEMSAGA